MKHNPDKPFEYSFQDEFMAKLHLSEERFHALFSCFTFLAIVIACMGLFGLITAMVESKTKEIGIRKVLGSSVAGIVNLLSKEFIRLVFISFLLAAPLAFVAADYWLRGFSYRIHIGWETFITAGCGTLAIAFLTISVRSVRAALANPVKSLRNE